MRSLCFPAARIALDTEGSQLLEFAVALPLLVVFIVGIFDFGNAFDLKQKLNNAARDGARLGASLPTSDLTVTTPPSVDAIHTLIANYLNSEQINDCGLAGNGAVAQTVQLSYTQPAFLVSTTNPLDLVTVNSMSLDSGGATRVIGASGSFSAFVGGDFGIAANQPNGTYSALFQLTADYQ